MMYTIGVYTERRLLKIVIIGGGAAGFFAALSAKNNNPEAEVLVLEKSAKLLSKVRISGGGRCNVTHACFEPKALVQNYPRGSLELLGPFHRFGPADTISWFKERGVKLKVEDDGRMFPVTDNSSTIIYCFLEEAKKLGVEIKTLTKIERIEKTTEGFLLSLKKEDSFLADRLILATGSSRGGFAFAESFGHSIVEPVPSLFTFNIPSFSLKNLLGVSVENASISIFGRKLIQQGPLLITHFGFSGPAALKLSAKEARFLAEQKYNVSLKIDWIPSSSYESLFSFFETQKRNFPKKNIQNIWVESIPKKLWKVLCDKMNLSLSLHDLSKKQITQICECLKNDKYQASGKTTNKEEFVTCGGVSLSEVSFKTMESKLCKGLFFCGEILDIDGITGGFNFQNAWTTGYISGSSASNSCM